MRRIKKYKEKICQHNKGEKIFHAESGKMVGYIYSEVKNDKR